MNLSSPIGHLKINLYHFHDLLTLNEVFFREDYSVASFANLQCVVDIGSNIGISLCYFLSQNHTVRAYGFEPLPVNLHKLHSLMKANQLHQRVEVTEKAISNFLGRTSFAIEPTGRYGGIGAPYEDQIEVECLPINHILETVLAKEARINVLKIDTEGSERTIIESINPLLAKKIDLIYAEDLGFVDHLKDFFKMKNYGRITILKNKNCHI
jgi:FkbM family methyltransferase